MEDQNGDHEIKENPTKNVTENGSAVELSNEDDDREKTDENAEENSEWTDLLGSGSILKKILNEGKPDSRPLRHYQCSISYVLALDEELLEVVEKVDDFDIQLGDCEVVQGLDVAIGLMNIGEKCLLKLAPRLAFGSQGLRPNIPPDTSVFYQVELLSAQPDEELESVSLTERKIRGNGKRERGNWWYGRGENTMAIQCYRRALDFLDEVEGGIKYPTKDESETTDATLQELLESRLSVYNNMAAAQIKLELYDPALNSLQTVLRCQPNNIKALFRKAKVHRAKNDLNSALKCLKKADEVAPNDLDVQKELAAVSKLMQKQKTTERELAKRMFADKSSSVPKDIKQHHKKPNALAWAATIAASFAVGLVGIAAYKLKFT